MKIGILDCIVRWNSFLQKPFMTGRERRIYERVLLGLQGRQPLDIFEYGSGFSTLYFARFLRSRNVRFHVHSVEHNKAWHLDIKRRIGQAGLGQEVTVHLSEFSPGCAPPKTPAELNYVNMPRALGRTFDLIVVDGRFRRCCLEAAMSCLKPQGIVFLHDAERTFYHGPLGRFKHSAFIDGGHYYPFEPRQHKVWLGSLDNGHLHHYTG